MGALVKPQPLQAASILLRFGVKELVDFPCLRPHDVVPGIQLRFSYSGEHARSESLQKPGSCRIAHSDRDQDFSCDLISVD